MCSTALASLVGILGTRVSTGVLSRQVTTDWLYTDERSLLLIFLLFPHPSPPSQSCSQGYTYGHDWATTQMTTMLMTLPGTVRMGCVSWRNGESVTMITNLGAEYKIDENPQVYRYPLEGGQIGVHTHTHTTETTRSSTLELSIKHVNYYQSAWHPKPSSSP